MIHIHLQMLANIQIIKYNITQISNKTINYSVKKYHFNIEYLNNTL